MKSESEPSAPQVDPELVTRASQGDRAALSQLIEQVQKSVFRFCVHLSGDRVLGEELAQETLVQAVKSLSSLRESDKLMSWLFQIAKNFYFQSLRKSSRESPSDSQDLSLESKSVEGEVGEGNRGGSEQADERLAVQQALSRLEPEDRYLIILVDSEGRSYQEAAEIIGVSESAVRSRLHRARKDFLEKMNAS